jgi:hypothetical protein
MSRIFPKPSTINWILNNSVGDVNYNAQLPHLTDDELFYCLVHEKRISNIRRLQREARKRLKKKISDKLNEPKWKNDIVKRIWTYARENELLVNGRLPSGLGQIVHRVRICCDRCGIQRHDAPLKDVSRYECCWVTNEEEDYSPQLCLDCHEELRKRRPHEVVSV